MNETTCNFTTIVCKIIITSVKGWDSRTCKDIRIRGRPPPTDLIRILLFQKHPDMVQ